MTAVPAEVQARCRGASAVHFVAKLVWVHKRLRCTKHKLVDSDGKVVGRFKTKPRAEAAHAERSDCELVTYRVYDRDRLTNRGSAWRSRPPVEAERNPWRKAHTKNYWCWIIPAPQGAP
jgi:hypothetical protein